MSPDKGGAPPVKRGLSVWHQETGVWPHHAPYGPEWAMGQPAPSGERRGPTTPPDVINRRHGDERHAGM